MTSFGSGHNSDAKSQYRFSEEVQAAAIIKQYSGRVHDDTYEELQAFNKDITCALEGNLKNISNADATHAAIMMARLFDATAKELVMVVGRYDGAVNNQDNYANAFRRWLEKKQTTRVLILDEPNRHSSAYAALKEFKEKSAGTIQVYQGSDATKNELLSLFNNGDVETHFAVFDKMHSRIEYDPNDFAAVGEFCNPNYASDLLQRFEQLKETATELDSL